MSQPPLPPPRQAPPRPSPNDAPLGDNIQNTGDSTHGSQGEGKPEDDVEEDEDEEERKRQPSTFSFKSILENAGVDHSFPPKPPPGRSTPSSSSLTESLLSAPQPRAAASAVLPRQNPLSSFAPPAPISSWFSKHRTGTPSPPVNPSDAAGAQIPPQQPQLAGLAAKHPPKPQSKPFKSLLKETTSSASAAPSAGKGGKVVGGVDSDSEDDYVDDEDGILDSDDDFEPPPAPSSSKGRARRAKLQIKPKRAKKGREKKGAKKAKKKVRSGAKEERSDDF